MKAEITKNNSSTEQRYKALEPAGTNEYAPREGFYQVIRKSRVPILGELCPALAVRWKEHFQDTFDKSFETKIQTLSFARNPYAGSAEKLEQDLKDKIIHVRSASKGNDGIGKFVVDWEILSSLHVANLNLRNLSTDDKLKAMECALNENSDEIDIDIDADVDYGEF